MIKNSGFERLYGVCLLLLGAFVIYGAVSAIDRYFVTGWISWGRANRRMTGEPALLIHGLYVVAGVWLSAAGLVRITTGRPSD